MPSEATDAPSYLGLLNAIAVAESRAYIYLSAWAEVTTDPEVRALLRKIALREGEHGMSFARRVNELGYDIRPTDDTEFKDKLAFVKSGASDREKLDYIGLLNYCPEPGQRDVFEGLFRDRSIDIETGALLGRYIAEERDTLRLVKACYDQLCAAEAPQPDALVDLTADPAPASSDARLDALEHKLDAVCDAVEALRRVVVPPTIHA